MAEDNTPPLVHVPGRSVDPRRDAALEKILDGMRRPAQRATFRRPGDEAGEDAGQPFYELSFGNFLIAVRADAMKAHITHPIESANLSALSDLIESCRFHRPGRLTTGSDKWSPICAGKEPHEEESAEYLCPGAPSDTLSPASMAGLSLEVADLLRSDDVDERLALQFRGLAVVPGETIASLVDGQAEEGYDVFGRPLMPADGVPPPTAGPNVKHVSDDFTASRYGYAIQLDGVLAIVSPIVVEDSGLAAHWCILDPRPRPVEPEMIAPWLQKLAVVEGIRQEAIDWMAHEIKAGRQHLGLHKIASGRPAVHGGDSELELLVKQEDRYGQLREDGSRSFESVDFRANVSAGQEIALLRSPTRGTPGLTVYGEAIPARDGSDIATKVGAGAVTREGDDGLIHFHADRDGVVRYIPGEVAVVDTMTIEGNVGFETGNLEFKGEVVVKGSITQGYNVKATGDVIVLGNVEGATIASGGNVVVSVGIIGRKSTVVARGDVSTQHVEESQLRAAEDIFVADKSKDATLRADGAITVGMVDGDVEGSLVGGRAWGIGGIDVNVAGGRNVTTELASGIDPKQARELDEFNHKLLESSKQIARQLARFQLDSVDVGAIQKLLVATTGPKKKILARAAKQLGEMVQQHQALLKGRKAIESQMGGGTKDVSIKIRQLAHSGVTVRIADHVDKIRDNMDATAFSLGSEGLKAKVI